MNENRVCPIETCGVELKQCLKDRLIDQWNRIDSP